MLTKHHGHADQLWRLALSVAGYVRAYGRLDLGTMLAARRGIEKAMDGMALSVQLGLDEIVRQEQLDLQLMGEQQED